MPYRRSDWEHGRQVGHMILNFSHQSSLDKLPKAIATALEIGYRHIDTAYVYHNEPEIGAALEDCLPRLNLKRQDVFITSKPGDADFPVDADGKRIIDSVSFLDTWKEMEKLVDDGLVKSIGVSNFNKRQIDLILNHCRIKPANLQVEIHANFPNTKLVEYAQSKGLTVTAYSPLGSPDGSSTKQNLLTEPRVLAVARKYNKSAAQVLLRYLHQRGIIVIPKSVTPERIRENFEIFDFELTSQDVEQLLTGGLDERQIKVLPFAHHPEYPFHDDY